MYASHIDYDDDDDADDEDGGDDDDGDDNDDDVCDENLKIKIKFTNFRW